MIPPGTYIARAVSAELGYTSGGKEQVGVTFEIAEGEHKGNRLGWYGYFHTEDTSNRTLESLEIAGWTGEGRFQEFRGLGSTECQIVVSHNEYQGKTRVKVDWVNRIGGAFMKSQMDQTQRDSFEARIESAMMARKTKREQEAAEGPNEVSDDIPF